MADTNLMKKETVLLVALGALVVGFLGGVVFSSFKTPGYQPTASAPQQQQPQQFDQQQAQQVLALEQQVRSNPNNGQAWVQLGNLYFDTNQPPKAIEAYNRALQIIPPDPNVLTDLGVMYRRNGQPMQAIESFKKAAALSPTHEPSRFNLGIVYLYDLKDKDKAIAAWQELLTINPNAIASNGRPIRDFIADAQQGK